MKHKRSDIKVNYGFRIEEKTDVFDIKTAVKVLNSKSQRLYTCVVNKGAYAELTSHTIICPFCGKEIPAYEDFINKIIESLKKLFPLLKFVSC